MSNVVCISGGYDPVHSGHIRHILHAAQFGDLTIILNSDDWLLRKKGYVFQKWEERAEILMAIKGVVDVVPVDDSDGTVCKALAQIRPRYMCKGGDRTKDNTPEQEQCSILGIEMLFGVGGDDKVQASSRLVEQAIQSKLQTHGIISGIL